MGDLAFQSERVAKEIRPAKTPWPQPTWALVAIMLASVLAAYLPALRGDFIWDDDAHVTAVPSIVGNTGLAQIWTSAAANYFPLTTSTFWAIHALWGLNPFAYHLVDVLLHAASALLLWAVLRQLKVRAAWLGAMLWALHPVQVDSAAWISETKNTQSAVFFLLAVLSFLKWIRRDAPEGRGRGLRFYVFAWLCAVLAILSKSSTVMLPVLLGLCWWWTENRLRWRWLLWLLPFFAISAAAAGWTIWEQQFHSGAIGPDWTLSWPQRVIIAGKDVWFYVGKLLWPYPLIMVYPRWAPDQGGFISCLPVLSVIGLMLLFWWQHRRLRPFLFAATYFGVSLFPVLGFFNVYYYRFSFVADHFQYLASMGLLALVGAGLGLAGDWLDRRHPWLARTSGSLLLLTLGSLTWNQCHHYRNDDVLWSTTLVDNPDAWLAHYNLAVLQEERPGKMPEAIAHYEATLRLYPEHWKAHSNLGNALRNMPNRLPDAIAHYEAALRINPGMGELHFNLGDALMRIPDRQSDAKIHLEEAVRINPRLARAHFDLGNLSTQSPNSLPETIAHYRAALQADPNLAEAHFNLGIALLNYHQPLEEAIAHFDEARRIKPDLPPAREIFERWRAMQ